MKGEKTKKTRSAPLTPGGKKELAALARLRDEEIDTDAIPETKNWSGAKRGVFYRRLKQ
jgi:hypothetical protein